MNQQFKYRAKCLKCGHEDSVVKETKEECKKIDVCPSCSDGAYVDLYYYLQYKKDKDDVITSEEREIMQLTSDISIKFKNLEQSHPSDINEVVLAIHRIQDIIACRIARRVVPDVFVSYLDKEISTYRR